MKKVFLSMLVLSAAMFAGNEVKAQQLKVAVFDIDLMTQAMPGYAEVDSLVQIYNTDSLGAEYNIYQSEYQRLDSTYKADSTAKKPDAVLKYTAGKRQEMAMNLVYWQQIAQNKSDQYRGSLAAPLYQRVVTAYKKVVAAKKYNLILKPDSYEVGFPIENMFPLVAKEMNVTLPQGLTIDPNQALQEMGTNPAGASAPSARRRPRATPRAAVPERPSRRRVPRGRRTGCGAPRSPSRRSHPCRAR